MADQAQLLPGTLDLLILKAVSLGPLHGYGILLRIGQISGNALLIEQGALYPALFRLVRQGLLQAELGHLARTIAGPSFTSSPPLAASASAKKTESWNRLPPPWPRFSLPDRRKYESPRFASFRWPPASSVAPRSNG